jgi:hypothetical protein
MSADAMKNGALPRCAGDPQAAWMTLRLRLDQQAFPTHLFEQVSLRASDRVVRADFDEEAVRTSSKEIPDEPVLAPLRIGLDWFGRRLHQVVSPK